MKVTFAAVAAYHWVLMIFLGAITFETLILYPNIFRDAPASLEQAVAFMKIGAGRLLSAGGTVLLLTGAAAVGLNWRNRVVRRWMLISVLIILGGEFLFSAFFFWPRNTIMFVEGSAVHSAQVLRQTAREFEALHWVRLGLCLPASIFSFLALLARNRAPQPQPQPSMSA